MRRFLLVFLMLALPLQAFASVALFACEHTRSHGMTTPAGQDPMHAAHGGCHEAAPAKPAKATADHQCSHCAACYLGAAFPLPAAFTTAAAPLPYSPPLQFAETFSGFIPEGPERPPRSRLA